METSSTQELLSQTPTAAATQPPSVGKRRDPGKSRLVVDDDRGPANPRHRTEPPGASSAHRSRRWRVIFAVGGVVALAALVPGVRYYLMTRSYEVTDAVVDGHIVHVAPPVAGRVLQVLVTDNQAVQAGDLLVQIDPMDFSLKLNQSIAAASVAHGLLEQARWQLLAAEVAQALAEIEVITTRASRKRTATKRTAAQLTVAQLKETAAVAQVNLARAQVATVEAGVAAAEAAVTQAGLELTDTEVRAPRSGRVMATNVETGEYVQVGKELLVLVSDNLEGPANFDADQHTIRPLTASSYEPEEHSASAILAMLLEDVWYSGPLAKSDEKRGEVGGHYQRIRTDAYTRAGER
jgi:membrane fusion protein (multidrug efflux system)